MSDAPEASSNRLLIISLLPWLFPARLASELQSVGFNVEVACRPQSPLLLLRRKPKWHRLHPVRERQALHRAIEAAQPHVIIPCDDPTVEMLHRLYEHDPAGSVAQAIKRSLGLPQYYGTIESRSDVLRIARTLGIRTPAARALCRRQVPLDITYPCVLKWDRSWGGQGVRIAHAQREVARHCGLAGGARALLRDFRLAYHDRRLAQVLRWPGPFEIQDFVAGVPANRAVLCRNGQVLAGHSVVALETAGPTEPATVVMPIDNASMASAAEVLVAAFGLSGFCGFDFILSDDGEAHFLELNARATPIAHIATPNGTHLPSSLRSALDGGGVASNRASPPRPILLFGRRSERFAGTCMRDAPHDEPELLRHCGWA